MSTTELVTAEKILSDLQAKFGMVDETWVSSYTKTAQSKNITLQEWNRVVEKVSANSSSTEALYTALEDSLALFGNLEKTVNTFDDRISTNKTEIENEVKRATAKESELSTVITNETTRATGAEDALSKRIDNNATKISNNTTAIDKNAGDISTLNTNYGTLETAFESFRNAVNDILELGENDPKLNDKLNELHEIIAYIDSNKSLIDEITIKKVNVADIIDRLDVKATDKPLSAAQGVVLRGLIASLDTALKSETTAREAAITEEANARTSADATHTAGIATLKTRLDSLDLPVIQHSLYEHSILVTTRDPNAPRPYVFLRCSIFNRISERLGLPEVLECLHSTLGKGTTLKTFSGYVEYNANSGVAVAEVVDLTTTLPTEILKYELSEDGNSYTCVGFADGYDYTDILMDVVIPSEYNGKPVTAIAGNAFIGQYIKSCVVPPTVTDIGYWAFGMNETLEYVHIPSSVTSIGDNAFTYSSNVNISCEAAEQPSGWSSTWNSDNRPVTWSSPVPDTALYVRYYDTSGVRNLLKISSSKISVYDAVSTVAQVSEGGGGVAIIECLTLPTQNISTAHFYRTSDGKLYWYDGSTWHRVVEDTGMFEILPAKENTVSSHTAPAYHTVPYKKLFHSELIGRASNFAPSVEDLSNLAIHVKYYYDDNVKERIYFLNELEVDATIPVIDGDVIVGEGYRYIVPSIAHREDTDAESVYPRVQVVVLFGEGVGFPVMSDEYGDSVTHTGVVSPAGYLGRAVKDYLDSDGNMQVVCTEVVSIDITAPTLKLKNTHLNLPDNYDFKLILEKIAELSKNPAENIVSITSGTPEIVEEEGMSITVTPITVTTSTGATHTFHIPALNGSGSSSSSGGYFEGTAAEYNEAADTVPVGAIVWLTDEEGNITTAVLDKAILGQMILGTS